MQHFIKVLGAAFAMFVQVGILTAGLIAEQS
jgi:hypothetical protein